MIVMKIVREQIWGMSDGADSGKGIEEDYKC